MFSMHTAHLANVSKSVTKNATFSRTGGLPCLITHSCMSAASPTVVGDSFSVSQRLPSWDACSHYSMLSWQKYLEYLWDCEEWQGHAWLPNWMNYYDHWYFIFIFLFWHPGTPADRISPATNQSWSEVWKMKCKFLCSDANFFDICGRGCDRGELRDDAW